MQGRVAGECDFRIFSASLDGSVRLWHPNTLACLCVYKGAHSDVSCMTFFEGWNSLITGHEDGEVVLWNVATGTHRTIGKHNNTVACMEMGFVWV
jgi:WD40 repeat protein